MSRICSCHPKCVGISLSTNAKGEITTTRCTCQSCHGNFHHLLDLHAKAVLANDRTAFLETSCQLLLSNEASPYTESTALMESWREWENLDYGSVIWAERWLASSGNHKSLAL